MAHFAHVLALGLLSLVGACKRHAPPAVAQRDLDAIAAHDAAVEAPRDSAVIQSDAEITRWSSPSMAEGLARACDFRPPGIDEDDSGEAPLGFLRCDNRLIEQSCSFDPCTEHTDTPCRRECLATCDGCSTRCRTDCGGCQSRCTDDACRRQCAQVTGACLDACVAPVDTCVTAVCTQRDIACRQREGALFQSQCAGHCRRCSAECERLSLRPQGEPNNCVARCLSRGRHCTEEQRQVCVWQGPTWPSQD
ncbi:MAG: hypothetical protein Q8Q09_19175 [Deltaproteobacteria bacterium]|nr:hypothetical protein [Deltaproteobacteria bacterium]